MPKIEENYENNQHQSNWLALQNLKNFKERFKKISDDIDINILEFSTMIKNRFKILELKNNCKTSYYLYDRSEITNYVEDLIHVIDIGKKILHSIFNAIEQRLNNTKLN